MDELRVLYIEHDDTWSEEIKIKCSKEQIKVDQLNEPSGIESISLEEMMSYDLVLTDVYWEYADTKEHKWVRLNEVIDNVREKNTRVPIVVLSEKLDSYNEAEKYLRAGELYDIWSKIAGYPEFLTYRIRKVVEARQNAINEDVLLEITKRICESNPSAWCNKEILGFLEKYKAVTGEGLKLAEIKSFFKDMGYKADLEQEFVSDVVGTFTATEPIDLARSPDAWGHLKHSLSIFLSGYILLNTIPTPFNKREVIEKLGLKNWEAMNKAWFLAGALHDAFVYLEHLPIIIKRIRGLNRDPLHRSLSAKAKKLEGSKVYNVDLSTIENCEVIYCPEDEKAVEIILEGANRSDLGGSIIDYLKNNKVDHGMLAAANLYNGVKTNPRCNHQVIKAACYSILIHNCIDKIGQKLDQKQDFLAQMLCLFDRFQAWGRENHYEGLFDGSCFEKIVLREFNLKGSNNKEQEKTLRMEIDYLPFNYLSPSDKYLKDGEDELKSILRKNFDSLGRMGFEREGNFLFWQGIKFDLTFCILGREISV